MNSMLDAQLAHQKVMKKILNEKQYEDWKKTRKNKSRKMQTKGKMPKTQGKNKGSMKANK